MRISINKKKLSEAVHIAARFAERKAGSLPALSSVLVIAGDDGIKLRATNLETGVDLKLEGDCESEGVVAVPANILSAVASSFSGDGVALLESTGETLTIRADTGTSSVKTVPYDDFPSIPFPERGKNHIAISGAVLKNLFASIAPCASPSTIRPELASVYLSIEGGTLTAVATDSFRLAEKKVSLASKGTQGDILIPAKNALDVAQALTDDEITMSFDDHQCSFVGAGVMLVSRLTNAAYPDYRQIIPKEAAAEATVLRRDFENALRRVTIFSDTFQKVRLSFDTKARKLEFFARNADVGESSEALSAQLSGSPLEISFNHRYLSAALGLTSAESVTLSAAGIGRPLIVRGVGDASLLYLVSPMNQ